MKISKKQLINLIETFIVDPKGRTIDYEEILKLEKEYAETEDPELFKKIDELKKAYLNLPYHIKRLEGDDEPIEREPYDQGVEVEKGLMMKPGFERGFDDEEAMLASELMYTYGKERGIGGHFDNQPGKVKDEKEGGYPSKKSRKKTFQRAQQYKKIDNLIGSHINDWFRKNKESLTFEYEIDDIVNEVVYHILEIEGYSEYDPSDLLENEPEFDEVFQDTDFFYEGIMLKIIEYCIVNPEEYLLTGIEGIDILNPSGGQYDTSGYPQPGGDPTVTYVGS